MNGRITFVPPRFGEAYDRELTPYLKHSLAASCVPGQMALVCEECGIRWVCVSSREDRTPGADERARAMMFWLQQHGWSIAEPPPPRGPLVLRVQGTFRKEPLILRAQHIKHAVDE